MIGIVLVTHGALGEAFLATLEEIAGPQPGMSAVSIGPDDDMAQRREDILAQARACDAGAGVVVLTDMFGGTPCNLAISLLQSDRVEVLAGLNLPMLIKLAGLRRGSLSDAVLQGQEAGRKYIAVASRFLEGSCRR